MGGEDRKTKERPAIPQFFTSFLLILILISSSSCHTRRSNDAWVALAWSPPPISRRNVMIDIASSAAARIGVASGISAGIAAATIIQPPAAAVAASSVGDDILRRRSFDYHSDWTGTARPLLSIREAAAAATTKDRDTNDSIISAFPMGKWPDPILRHPASPVPKRIFGTTELRAVAEALRKTAREEGAVGLAAQQCGVDGRLLWIDTTAAAAAAAAAGNDNSNAGSSRKRQRRQTRGEGIVATTKVSSASDTSIDEGLYLVNPRITWRSSEINMLPWTETCLVLPPAFTATVLRDASITVEYEDLYGDTLSIDLEGELARCVQHEMDHDRGILLLDHIDFTEMEGGDEGIMAKLESEGHSDRMIIAFGRAVVEPSLLSS